MKFRAVCVYCGSNAGNRPAYASAARETGALLAKKGITVVFGGGVVGLMGVVANAALAAGGQAIGVIPEDLVARELAHRGVTELKIVKSMHHRKATMETLSEGFIALPGGLGTMEELCEMLTWGQLGIHGKPCGLLNVSGYYDSFLAWLDRAVRDGFLPAEQRASVLASSDPADLIDKMEAWKPYKVRKWMDREDT